MASGYNKSEAYQFFQTQIDFTVPLHMNFLSFYEKAIGDTYMNHFMKKTLCGTSVSLSEMLLSFFVVETLQKASKVQSRIRR